MKALYNVALADHSLPDPAHLFQESGRPVLACCTIPGAVESATEVRMPRLKVSFFTAVLAVSSSGDPAAQPVPAGTRVRVTHTYACVRNPAGQVQCSATFPRTRFTRVVGTMVTLAADSMILRTNQAEALALPFPSIARLEISRGQKSRVAAGVGYGALAGFGTGAIVGVVLCRPGCGDETDLTPLVALVTGGIGAGAGALIGGLIGANSRSDRWERVPLDRPRVALTPTRDGIALVVSVAF